jgi:hypothetical protein
MAIVKPYPHPDDWMKEKTPESLQEMASSPKKAEEILTRYSGTTLEHLLKLFYFRNFTDYFHNWTNAVYKSAYYVPKLKSPPRLKNKFPPAEMIYEWMWSIWEGSFENYHAGFIGDVNNKSNPDYQYLPYIHKGGDVRDAEKFAKDYHLWLAKELSKGGRVKLMDVQDEIKLLFKKYPV